LIIRSRGLGHRSRQGWIFHTWRGVDHLGRQCRDGGGGHDRAFGQDSVRRRRLVAFLRDNLLRHCLEVFQAVGLGGLLGGDDLWRNGGEAFQAVGLGDDLRGGVDVDRADGARRGQDVLGIGPIAVRAGLSQQLIPVGVDRLEPGQAVEVRAPPILVSPPSVVRVGVGSRHVELALPHAQRLRVRLERGQVGRQRNIVQQADVDTVGVALATWVTTVLSKIVSGCASSPTPIHPVCGDMCLSFQNEKTFSGPLQDSIQSG
jgi:hypothetical protein